MFVVIMHGLEIQVFLENLLHAQLFYCKYPGMKLENWDGATCRTFLYNTLNTEVIGSFVCVCFCQNRPS